MAVLSFVVHETYDCTMATHYTVFVVCFFNDNVRLSVLDHVATFLSNSHNIHFGADNNRYMRHIIVVARLHIARIVQPIGSL